jgi:hypothetical protein
MRADLFRYAAIGAFAWLMLPGGAGAEDNQAGTTLTPGEAAGAWTLQSAGHPICIVTLRAQKAAGAGFALDRPASCGDALVGAVAWSPAADGMTVNGADGQVLIAFRRWSNSLLVAPRSTGEELQLQRGGPSG